MDVRVDAIQNTTDIPECMSILQIQQTMAQDEHLQHLKNIINTGWPSTKDQLHINTRPYWSYKDNLAVIDGVVMKGRCIIIPQDPHTTWGMKKPNYSHANLFTGSILITTWKIM